MQRLIIASLILLLSLHAIAQTPATTPSDPQYTADPSRNVFTAGVFGKLDHEKPVGWADTKAFDDGDASMTAGGRSLQLAADSNASAVVSTVMPLKPEWGWLTVAARERGQGLKPAAGGKASVNFILLDADGKPIRTVAEFEPRTQGYTDWQEPSRSFKVDDGAKSLRIEITIAHCDGDFEIGEVLVVPNDPSKELTADQVEALHDAIDADDAVKVKQLISADKRYLEARNRGCDGGTPLIMTAWIDKPEITKLLIEAGADVYGVDRNWKQTALCWAGFWGRPAVAKLLLDAQTDAAKKIADAKKALGSAEFAMKSRKSGDATDDERREVIQLLKDASTQPLPDK